MQKTPADRQAAYAALNTAYDQQGIPALDRKAMPDQQADAVVSQYNQATPEQKVGILSQWKAEMGPLFNVGMGQLSKRGMTTEAYMATIGADSPQLTPMLATAVRGMDRMAKDKGEDPSTQPNLGAPTVFRINYNPAAQSVNNPNVNAALYRMANAIYIEQGGDPKNIDKTKYAEATRMAAGSTNPSDPDTGIVNMGGGKANYSTILPPGTSRAQFSAFTDALTPHVLARLSASGQPPIYTSGKPALPQDIADEGVFVQVQPGYYQIRMKDDGGVLRTSSGTPYIMKLESSVVSGIAALSGVK